MVLDAAAMPAQVAAMLSQAGPLRKISSSQANGAEPLPEENLVFEGEVLYVSGVCLHLSVKCACCGRPDEFNVVICATQHRLRHLAGEESVEQIGSRAERMGLMSNRNIFLYSATRMEVRELICAT